MASHDRLLEAAGAPSDRRHVLVIEDDEVVVELIQSIVARLGFIALVAEDASQALSEFERCRDTAVCVILDYGIPGMDASRLLSELREIKSDVKVLLSSGYPSKFIERDFPLESVDAFIPKPYEPKILIEQLKALADA